MIRAEDRAAFRAQQRAPFTRTHRMSPGGWKHTSGLPATPLVPPATASADQVRSRATYGDYSVRAGPPEPLQAGRSDAARLGQRAPGPMRLVIAGVPENPAYLEDLRSLAAALGISGRVEWLGGIDDATMIRHYAQGPWRSSSRRKMKTWAISR